MKSASGPFEAKTVALLAVLSTLSLGGALLLAIYDDALFGVPSVQADAFSRSALGHRALVDFLSHRGHPVLVSRHDAAGRAAADDGWLVVAEPRRDAMAEAVETEGEGYRSLREMLEVHPRMLLVLPKWQGMADPQKPDFIKGIRALPIEEVNAVLDALGASVRAERLSLDSAEAGLYDREVSLPAPQVLVGEEMWPIVGTEEGALIAEIGAFETGRIVVISDPDLISNHGLRRGANAATLLEIFDRDGHQSRAMVFDETLHGHRAQPSIYRELLAFPLVLFTAQCALLLILLLWSAAMRFGSPEPAAIALDAGKRQLIDNTASLLHVGGHGGSVLRRYFDVVQQQLARRFHIAQELSPEARLQSLEQLAKRRGDTQPAGALAQLVNASARSGAADRRVLAAARRIHRWRDTLLGAGGHRRGE